MTAIPSNKIYEYVRSMVDSLKSRKWWSIRILYSVMFVNIFTTSTIITNLYPFLKSLNEDTTDLFYSCTIAVYPLGIVLSSPLLGYWFNRSSTRQPLVFALSIVFLSCASYAYSNRLPGNVAIWVVLVSRFMMGVASGSRSVISAYITAATTVKERSDTMTNLYMTIPLAFIIGPLVGVMFEPLGTEGFTIPLIRLSINIYTSPIIVCALLTVFNLVIIIWFKEFFVTPVTTRNTHTDTSESLGYTELISDSNSPHTQTRPYDRIGFSSLAFTSFCSYLLVTTTDSLLTPLTMDQFAWTSVQAITYNNLLISSSCIFSLFSMRLFIILQNYVQERLMFLLVIMLISLAFFIYIPWPRDLPELIQGPTNHTTEMVGCNFELKPWCLWVPKLHLFQFILATIAFCTIFPNIYSASNTIASKVIGPHPPGILMGILTASTGIGRCVGPIIFVSLYSNYGPQITFAALDLVVMSMILVTVVTYKRIAPYS